MPEKPTDICILLAVSILQGAVTGRQFPSTSLFFLKVLLAKGYRGLKMKIHDCIVEKVYVFLPVFGLK